MLGGGGKKKKEKKGREGKDNKGRLPMRQIQMSRRRGRGISRREGGMQAEASVTRP